MTLDHDLDQLVRDAIDAHGDSVSATRPAFDELLERQQRTTRRRAMLASAAVVALGFGGIVAVVNHGDDPAPVAEPADTDATTQPVAPTTVAPEWFCSGYLGVDTERRELFSECESVDDLTSTDWACAGRLGVDDVGRVRFSDCEPLGTLGQVPVAGDDLGVSLEVFRRYTVQPGDYGIKIAETFCVSLEELERANGWDDVSTAFPAPDSSIRIPSSDVEPCGTLYVVQEGDYLIAIAERFCITLEALLAANSSAAFPVNLPPGTELLVPPTVSPSCEDER